LTGTPADADDVPFELDIVKSTSTQNLHSKEIDDVLDSLLERTEKTGQRHDGSKLDAKLDA